MEPLKMEGNRSFTNCIIQMFVIVNLLYNLEVMYRNCKQEINKKKNAIVWTENSDLCIVTYI